MKSLCSFIRINRSQPDVDSPLDRSYNGYNNQRRQPVDRYCPGLSGRAFISDHEDGSLGHIYYITTHLRDACASIVFGGTSCILTPSPNTSVPLLALNIGHSLSASKAASRDSR